MMPDTNSPDDGPFKERIEVSVITEPVDAEIEAAPEAETEAEAEAVDTDKKPRGRRSTKGS